MLTSASPAKPRLKQFDDAISPENSLLVFDGDFESANIDQVRKRDNRTYEVWIRDDTNGAQDLQWFMFRMRNNFEGRVKISIVNFTKRMSLF